MYFWAQGDNDIQYLSGFENAEGTVIIPPSIKKYKDLLSEDDLDYVGTRLHGGIYAIRHRKRSIIVSIDERAREIGRDTGLNCLEREEIGDKLEKMINSRFETEIRMPYDKIEEWKSQFGF